MSPVSPDQSRSLSLNVAWTVVGNFGFAACQWLMLVVLAKLGSPELIGQYALALGITAPIMLLGNLNLRAVQSTDIRDRYPFLGYFKLRLVTTLLALAVCLVTVLIGTLSTSTSLVVGFVALAKAAESMSDVFYGRLQKSEQMDRIAHSMLWRGIGSLLVMAAVIWAVGSVVLGAFGVFLVWFAVLAIHDVRSATGGLVTFRVRDAVLNGWRWGDLKCLMPLAWLALPLGIVQMLISLNVNVPRFFIQSFLGEHDLGIYSAIAYVTIAGSTFVTAVGQAVSPRLAHMYEDGDLAGFVQLLQKLAVLFLACCGLAVGLVIVSGKTLLTILYTPEYARESSLLLIMAFAFGVGSLVSIFGFGITAARHFRPQVPLVALALTTATIASAVLVPRMGLTGAAWAVLVSLAVWAVASGCVLWFILYRLRPVEAGKAAGPAMSEAART
jgi:O-antigen/teichoic acid export membrane protein